MPSLIRPVQAPDVPGILRLWRELTQFHADIDIIFSTSSEAEQTFEKYLRDRLQDENSLELLAEESGSIIGYCLASIRERAPIFELRKHGYLTDLCVTSRYRRQSVGEALFSQARDWILSQGVSRIELRTISANSASTSFWNKMGFRTYAEEKFLEANTAQQGAAANP